MSASLGESIERACQRAAREVLLLHAPQCVHDLPPSAAVEAERQLVGALLAGSITLSALAPVNAAHCFVGLHAAVIIALDAIEATDLETTIPRIIIALRSQDIGGTDDAMADELLRLRDDAPAVVDVGRLTSEILDAARRRQLSRALRDADIALRTGAPVDDTTEKLMEALRG